MRATPNPEIASDWRSRAVSDLPWERSENQAGAYPGLCSGFMVSAPSFPRRAYMKPGNAVADDLYLIAAREKIVSDLAHDLGFTVPPAQLTRRVDPPDGCPKAVVVTLVMYPAQFQWEWVKEQPFDDSAVGRELPRIFREASPTLALDTWVDQRDHGDHPHNIVWGYDPENLGDSRLVFLDYARSLGFHGAWEAGGWKTMTRAQFPRLLKEHQDVDALHDAAYRIAGYSDKRIREIVDRVPDEYANPAQRRLIIDGLIGRKRLVFSTITPHN